MFYLLLTRANISFCNDNAVPSVFDVLKSSDYRFFFFSLPPSSSMIQSRKKKLLARFGKYLSVASAKNRSERRRKKLAPLEREENGVNASNKIPLSNWKERELCVDLSDL